MKYTSVNIDTPKKPHKPSHSGWKKFISGDFLIEGLRAQSIPFIIVFFALAFTAIMNEKSIKNKTKKINNKEIEYKLILNELRKNNHFIPYDQVSIIQEKAKEMGFVKSTPNTYKLTITTTPAN